LQRAISIQCELIVYWSEEDPAFVVEVPELPGCMADGSSYQEAVANAQRVIEDWIDTAQGMGRPIPEPKGRLMYALPTSGVPTAEPILGRRINPTLYAPDDFQQRLAQRNRFLMRVLDQPKIWLIGSDHDLGA
jgi:predicted RNase H-like HicB family nuclease